MSQATDMTAELLRSIRDELRLSRAELSSRLDLQHEDLQAVKLHLGKIDESMQDLALQQADLVSRVTTLESKPRG